jgi:uncharacterized membrane protein YkvA (DUF1232 family)
LALSSPRSVTIFPPVATDEGAMPSERSGEATFDAAPADEGRLRREFWVKLKRVAAKLPFVEDLLAAYYCAFDRETPLQVKAALVGAIGYFLLPIDVLPDIMPLLGFTDDAAVLATALRMVAVHMRPEHREAARQAIQRGLEE